MNEATHPPVDAPNAIASLQASSAVPVLIVVEGVHDCAFLRRISALLHAHDPRLPDLARWEAGGRVVFIPIGGDDFLTWAARLAPLGHAAFFLLDRDLPPLTMQRHANAAAINQRPRHVAVVPSRRGLANYLSPEAIEETCGLIVAIDPDTDVASLLARQVLAATGGPTWGQLPRRPRQRLLNRIKRMLHITAVERMTTARLAAQDPDDEVAGWLRTIALLASPSA